MKHLKLIFACLLTAIFSIGQVWADNATYSVTSTSAVSVSGAPSEATASYSSTYTAKEQLTAGNSMTLTLSGYAGYKITGITLSMKSNSSKGAGSFSAVAGTTTIASISDAKFNDASWYGAWSTSYVNVVPAMTDDDYEIQENEDVVLTISASANSIYCNSFIITYEDASSTCETLAAPTNPSATPAQTSVELNWDAVTNASGYKVAFNGTDYDIASGITTKTIEGLAMETEYHWTVAAKGEGTTYCAAGTPTAQQSVTTLDACTANKAIYTVASKTSVTPSGALEGSTVTFSNNGTNSNDQMTSGKSMTLTLSGYDGATIKGLTLSMHSNGSSGAGTFSLVIGSTTVAEISSTTFNKWFDNDSYGTTYRNVHVSFEDDVVVGTNEDIVVTIAATSNSLYCQSFTFCYDDPAPVAVAKPTFTLATGTYLGGQNVEIECATAGAAIYYTLDNTDPTSASTPYPGTAIAISETKTLKAIAIKGSDESAIASATYTIITTTHAGTSADPYTVADARIVIDGVGTKTDAYVSGIISQVDSYDGTHKSITYWISDDGTTTNQLEVYSGKGLNGADFSSKDDVVVKASVVVMGTLKKFNSTYEFDYNNVLVSYAEPAEPIVTLKQSSSTVTTLNVDASSVANQAIDIVCANFTDPISSVIAKLYEESTCETEITSGAWVTDITVNGAKDQVTFNVADNADAARQVWMKVTAGDGTSEASAVLAISQAKSDCATLPFAFDGGRADIATKFGMSQDGLDTDYGSSPKLKFNSTGDVVIIKFNADPGTLTYDIKGNSFSESTFKVQESADGLVYSDVASYTELDTESESYDLEQTTRYVKFIYTQKVNGNVALGNITISEYEAPVVKPTITTQPVGAAYTQGDTPAALTIVAEAANGGELSYQWYSNSSESTEGAVAIEGADEDEYTPSTASIETTYYYCVVTEVGADEPTTSDIVAIVVSAAPEPTGTFELFSGDLAEGDYVICSGTTALKNALATNTNYIGYETVIVSENKITNPAEELIWHIAASDDYWTIYNAAATNYAASTGAKNKGQVLTDISGDNADKALWAASGSSSYEFVNKANTAASVNANLRYNDTYGFACYSTSTGAALTLYKKDDGTPTFTPAAGSYLGTQSVTISAADGASIYYTTDGTTTPTTSSTLYTGVIEVSTTTTIKAIAVKDAVSSNVATATYTIINTAHAGTAEDPYSVADAKIVIDGIGTKEDAYVSGIISQVDSYNSTYKSITYWISADGTTSGQQLQVYSGKGIDGADFSSVDDVVAKATVVVKGTLKKHNDTYEFDYNNELVSYAAPVEPVVTLKQSGSTVTVLNLEATGVANQAIDIVCANFTDPISSVIAKLYEESTCETEITSGAWVTDITVNGAKDQVTFNVADNADAARQVWLKVTASDGSNSAFAVLNIKQAKYTVDYAELPFEFEGGKNDVVNTNGMSHSGLGSDYSTSPKLKFDNTGDWLIIRINEAPAKLTYSIKNNGFSGGTFTVQESADGETYTEVASHTEITNTQNEEVDLKQATRYIKFIYTEKVSGNVGLGNITISKSATPEPPVENWTEVRDGLNAGEYYTMCLDKAVTAVRGGTIWKIVSKADKSANPGIILEDVVGTLDAGRPYIFRATADKLEVVYTGDAVLAPLTEGNNGLIGSFSKASITKDESNYIIYNNELYYVNSDNVYVGANRAYVNMAVVPDVPSSSPAPGRHRVTMGINGATEAQGIDNVGASEKPMKMMIDGQLFIIRGEKMYDATGKLVK